MAKFNVGDKVVVRIPREILEGDRSRTPSGLSIPNGMFNYNGETAIITEVRNYDDNYDNARYCIDLDKGYWVWDNYCFGETEEKGGTPIMVENIMNMDVEPYVPTDEEMKYLMETGKELLWHYQYNPTDAGMTAIYDEWAKQNAWMIDLFKKSPNYVDGKFYIKLPATIFKRGVNMGDVREYVRWCRENARDIFAKSHQCMVGLHTLADYMTAKNKLYRIYDNLNSLGKGYTYYGKTIDEIRSEYERMQKRINDIDYCNFGGYYIPNEYAKAWYAIGYLFEALTEIEDVVYFTEKDAKMVNEYAERIGLKARAHTGNKVSKFYGKVCRELGLESIVDIYDETWIDQDGNFHTRQKDRGYNKYRVLFGEAVTPLEYKRDIIISVNPIDFWTMSLGYKWASCLSIDKHNIRGCNNNYEGQYSGGTTSYMLDNTSFIVYVLPSEDEIKQAHEEGREDELKSKLKRCVFSMGEDKLIQSRVYPDGRDGGDEALPTQLRNIVQKVLADCLGANNLWTLKKGSCNVSYAYRRSDDAVGYDDLNCCSDVTVSYLKRADGSINDKRITIGAQPICPNCGRGHYNNEAIECDRCYEYDEGYSCDRCGEHIREDDDDAIRTVDDRIFCCYECAEREGYQYCEDSREWEYDYNYDEYDGNYYHYTDDSVYTYEDRWYCSDYNAEADGNRYCEDINKWSMEWVETVEGNYFHDTDDLIEVDGNWYESTETIENNGYVLDEDGEYVLAA